jgi:signal transduction histidine kinase
VTWGGSWGAGEGTPSEQVQTALFRALIVLRFVVAGYALTLNAARFDELARPGLALAALVVLVGWTGFASWAYDAPRRRRWPLLVADLAVAAGLILLTPLVQSQAMLDRHASTVPSFWVMAAVLAWAAARGWLPGVLAAAVIGAADLSVRTDFAGATWGNLFLLVLGAGVVGYAATTLQDAAELRARADHAAAVLAERTRLARAVHDGVLQVLALVQRRSASAEPVAAGELAELGRLAGEQEAALRALVQYDARALAVDPRPGTDRPADATDLVATLAALQSPHVAVTGPGEPVTLTAHQTREVAAVVVACLDNVAVHVGSQAPAWVLVEDLGSSVVVTVRDEGPGIAEGRLEEAAREGRLGVRSSICGRMSDLGGTAELLSTPGGGTEWELTLPRP